MGNLITHHKKPVKPTITDADRAVLSLKAQRRKLEAQTSVLEKRIEASTAAVKELLGAKKKERALLALKKRKMDEKQLSSIQAWLLNVEGMLSDMEISKQQSAVFSALQSGNEALKQAQAEMSVDDIQKLMDDTAESKEYMDKVQDILAGQLTDSDAAAVEAEFEELEAQALAAEVAGMPTVPVSPQQTAVGQQAGTSTQQPAAAAAEAEELPSVPTTKVEAPQQAAAAAVEEAEPQRAEPLLAS